MPNIALIMVSDELITGVMTYAREHRDWSLRPHPLRHELIAEEIRNSPIDGILVEQASGILKDSMNSLGKPVVGLVARDLIETYPSVRLDEEKIGAVGANHLMGCGRLTFAYAGASQGNAQYFSAIREKGYINRLTAAGHECHVRRFGWMDVARRSPLREWLNTLPRPLGLMCFNDHMASAFVDVAPEEIPSEISVLGVDDDETFCTCGSIPLSSINRNLRALGYQAAVLLDRLMTGKPPDSVPRQIEPLGVIARKSTALVAFGNDVLSRALSFIRAEACLGIDISDVVKQAHVSRRKLERLFRSELNRSIGDEIRAVRLSHARRLLLETDLYLSDIAVEAGFEYSSYFSKAFKESFGMTPSGYRHRYRRSKK